MNKTAISTRMNIRSYVTIGLLALTVALASCRSGKSVVSDKPTVAHTSEQTEILSRVVAHTQQGTQYFGSKLKFSVDMGSQQVSVSGTLRMKRDDVIRLQLMALGLMEAARLEFTRDSVLLMDRINRQYLKAPYSDVDFLRDSGINFNMLQALFWNELFQPGKTTVDLQQFSIDAQTASEATVSYNEADATGVKGRMLYQWLVNVATGCIQKTTVGYRDSRHGNTDLDWEYGDFKEVRSKLFPSDMQVKLSTPKKQIRLGMKLSSFNNDSDWETRTRVSSRYKKVDVDEILRRVMAL